MDRASGNPARPVAASPPCASAMRLQHLRRPCCAATENRCGRTASRRPRRRHAARTTGSPRARSRVPADDRAPGCRRSCPRRRRRSISSRSSASKLLTPQERIFPALDQFVERGDRVLQRIRAAPVQQIAIEPIGLQPLQRALAGGDGAARARRCSAAPSRPGRLRRAARRSPRRSRARHRRTSPRCRCGSCRDRCHGAAPRPRACGRRDRCTRCPARSPATCGPLLPNFCVRKIASFVQSREHGP